MYTTLMLIKLKIGYFKLWMTYLSSKLTIFYLILDIITMSIHSILCLFINKLLKKKKYKIVITL